MPELLQQSINGNELLVFAVALFFSVISGQKMELGQRVALVYSYCLIVGYCNYIDFYAIAFGSLTVLFLIFEVFSSDTMLVHLFSFKYKCFDFLFRLLFEFYGVLFFLVLFISVTPFATSRGRPTRRRLWSRGCDGFASSRSCPASPAAFGVGSRRRLRPQPAMRDAGPRCSYPSAGH